MKNNLNTKSENIELQKIEKNSPKNNENKLIDSNLLIDNIQNGIYTIRGVQFMIDSDLAELYNVETKQIDRAVKRNKEQFPDNFCFQLTEKEFTNLRFQDGTSKIEWGGRRYLPYVFQN